jgi:hypothetical protein
LYRHHWRTQTAAKLTTIKTEKPSILQFERTLKADHPLDALDTGWKLLLLEHLRLCSSSLKRYNGDFERSV